MKRTTCGLIAFVLIGASLGAQISQVGPAPTGNLEARAAAYLGLPAQSLADACIQEVHLPTLGVTLTVVKAFDTASGEVIGGTFDPDGRAVDLSQMRALELQAREFVPGAKIHRSLAERMAQASGTGHFQVVIWLHFDGAALDQSRQDALGGVDLADEKARDTAEAQLTEKAIALNADIVKPFVAMLEGAGISTRYASTTAPAVFVTVDATQIAMLAELPQVDTLYLEELVRQDINSEAQDTHRTYRVHNYGVKGRGIKVAMLENNGIDPACPYLNVQGWFNAGTPNPDDHIHGTSGCVASLLASRPGAAPDVLLYSANAASYSDTDITAAADWIATQNIDATNMSFGGPLVPSPVEQYLDRYFDYQARYYADSYVASTGNDGLTDYVSSPGKAWNVLTVGGIDNLDTGDWRDDTMYTSSSSLNPANGCEKPNVVGVAVGVNTLGDGATGGSQTTAWLYDNYSGTSFSSPAVTGNLANAMVADPTLKTYPEACIAMMMATAWNNIEGSSRLSGQDGAGAINGLAAYRASLAANVKVGTFTSSSFNTNGYYTTNIWLQGGDKARVCLAWFANADSGYSTTVLDADLDLAIYAGQNQTSGSYYGGSASVNNNFEIVEFMPPSTGWYTVRVEPYAFNGTSEHYGICWSQRNVDGVSARLREYTSETSPKTGPTIGNQNYYMDWDARSCPNATYISYPSGTINQGISFSDLVWCHLDFDLWGTIWLDNFTSSAWFWTNSVATLNSNGNYYSHKMWLPDYSVLVGAPLHHVGITGDPLLSNPLQDRTEVHTFKFWPNPVNLFESDDGFILQNLPFGFKFYGTTHTQCHVNMNGNVTFGAGSYDFTETVSDLLANEPRICGIWTDLGPHQPGSQTGTRVQTRQIYQNDQELVVEFINVPFRTATATGTGSNTFRIHLHQDDSITIEYSDCTIDDCIVGISPGGGISSATEQDLSNYGLGTSGTNQALFQDFNSGSDPFDLAHPTFWFNKLRFVPTSSAATNYRLEVDVDQ